MTSLVRGPVAETLRAVVPSDWTVSPYVTEPDRLDAPRVMVDHLSYQPSTIASLTLEASLRVWVLIPKDRTPSPDGIAASIEDAVDDATAIVLYALLYMDMVTVQSASRTVFPRSGDAPGIPAWQIDLTLTVPITEEPEPEPEPTPDPDNMEE